MTEDGLDLPECLKLTPEQRKLAWEGVPVTVSNGRAYVDEEDWEKKQRFYREAHEAEQTRKNAVALEKLKESHPGQVYDRKLRQWITAPVTED